MWIFDKKGTKEKLLFKGRVCTKRSKGRPCHTGKKSIEWTKLNFEQCVTRAEDRDYCRVATTNLLLKEITG